MTTPAAPDPMDSVQVAKPVGFLLAFEGIDGVGKTTQFNRTVDWLRASGETVVASKEPTEGPWGQKIRRSRTAGRMPVYEEIEAFVQDRKEHINQVIAPALARREIVVLDRYFYSTIAYQGARVPPERLPDLYDRAMDGVVMPDLMILLSGPPTETLERITKQRKEALDSFEEAAYLKKVLALFNGLASSPRHKDVVVTLNAMLDVESVWDLVRRTVRQFLAAKRSKGSWPS